MPEVIAENRFGHWGSDKPNPNLALAQISIKIEPEQESIEEFLGDVPYTQHELENLEAYYVVATAIIYLKVTDRYFQVIELSESVGGVTVFSWDDDSYLKESGFELVEALQDEIEKLGVPAGSDSLDQYVTFNNDPIPNPSDCEFYPAVTGGTIHTGNTKFPMIDFGGKS